MIIVAHFLRATAVLSLHPGVGGWAAGGID